MIYIYIYRSCDRTVNKAHHIFKSNNQGEYTHIQNPTTTLFLPSCTLKTSSLYHSLYNNQIRITIGLTGREGKQNSESLHSKTFPVAGSLIFS